MPGIDHLLMESEIRGRPIRVGIIGAGATVRMIARHLVMPVPGIRLCAIANRTISRLEQLCVDLGIANAKLIGDSTSVDALIEDGKVAITDDAERVCVASQIDVIVEVTGTVEFGARIVLKGIEHRKHCVLVNAELDATLGPILKTYADRQGVVITNTDGDEPGVAMTLLRYLRSLGLTTVGAGNLKGMIDPYRNPDTQRDFAARHGMDPYKVTSFADGTKLSMEAAILSNASGFRVGKRGMYGPQCAHVREIAAKLPMDQLLDGGLVDYALGADPYTGAFVIIYDPDQQRRSDYAYFKMGEGPLYVLYTPYHLPQLQVVYTIAMAYFYQDATVSPAGGPTCEVATIAKRDLHTGEVLDGIGGYTCYGTIENSEICQADNLLPMGLSQDCRVKRYIPKDQALTYEDVVLPENRLADKLRAEQNTKFIKRF